ncbi:TerB family tellurite resistance protein [Reichenbachiella sp. MALMAid0571]|uniref:TerB family tellurite resistance protein n=1 Tax=Reichenbachiella sp. MALMAid0571 TaxID=3143939 RepID=UPI0032E02E4C
MGSVDFNPQLSLLIQLSLIDNNLSPKEQRMIYALGKANKIPEKEIEEVFNYHLRHARHEMPTITNLSDEDKFDYLFNIVQLMKVDEQVYLSEIKFCQNLAEKLGFKKNVVKELSARIFSDPTLTIDKEGLKEQIMKYRI